MKDNLKRYGANLTLLLVALIWGAAFVTQNTAGNILGTFTICFSRYLIGAIVLIPVYFIFKNKSDNKTEHKDKIKNSVIGGTFCGLALFSASAFQQLGIIYGKDEGKAGFITVMYVIIVPIIGLFFKKKINFLTWIAIALAPVGLYMLCIEDNFKIQKADALLLICALIFSMHIMLIDRFSPKADGILMSCIQFFVTAVVSGIFMVISEPEYIKLIPTAILDLLYLGVLSSGVGYTLQIIAQKYTYPTVASLIMSLESVFAMLLGALYSGTMPTTNKLIGGGIIFAAVILAQLPAPKSKKCSV